MEARMNHPAFIVPDAMPALQALKSAVENAGVPAKTIGLVELRASQVNGCEVCSQGHPLLLKKAGESDERIAAVASWRSSRLFTDAERAALALTEAVTRIGNGPDPVPDAVWNEAARYYDERALAALVLAIANINVWNRLNIATCQVPGIWKP